MWWYRDELDSADMKVIASMLGTDDTLVDMSIKEVKKFVRKEKQHLVSTSDRALIY